jgi:hypothetical protein
MPRINKNSSQSAFIQTEGVGCVDDMEYAHECLFLPTFWSKVTYRRYFCRNSILTASTNCAARALIAVADVSS